MNGNLTKWLVALAAMAHQAHSTALCTQEKPIHSYITDVQEQTGERTFLESYVTISGDGYELVLYRISRDCNARVPAESDKGPMLLIHGTGKDASQWMEKSDEVEDSIGMKYALEGYDVWYGNLRGSGPSRAHRRRGRNPDGEGALDDNYWEFDYNNLAEEDLPAMIRRVIAVNGSCKKVTLIGYSLGGTILANGLSKSTYAKKYVAQAISIAPCFMPSADYYFEDVESLSLLQSQILGTFIDLYSIKSLFGPDWDLHKENICSLSWVSSLAETACTALNADSMALYSSDNPNGPKEVSSRLIQHLADNVRLGDYMRYGMLSNHEPSADLTQVEVPMSFMYGTSDLLCPRSDQQRFIDLIPTVENESDLEADHLIQSFVNETEFRAELDRVLTHSGERVQQCLIRFAW